MKHGDPATAKGNEPAFGSTVTMTTAIQGHRSVFKLTAENGWSALFSSRLSALSFAIQCGLRVRASALDDRGAA